MGRTAVCCNLCGKEFTACDVYQDFKIDKQIGYGSKYDGDHFRLDLCCDCLDKVVDNLMKECKHKPITFF